MPIHLTPSAAAAVRRGHPWVYREGVARAPRGLATGDVIELVDGSAACRRGCAAAGAFLGRGLWDAGSTIAVRVFQHRREGPLDEAAIAARLERAFALRDAWFGEDGATTAYRLAHGEGDRVPGLVIDRYGPIAVVRLDGDALRPWLDRLLPRLATALERRGVCSIGLRAARPQPGERRLLQVHGPPIPDRIVVREASVAMEVDLARGQKTGAFLDQRENRARVRALAAGRARVLNLFSYAGGFSLAAVLGRAGRVTSVDSAASAHASAQRSFRENGLDPAAHEFVTADAFDFLDRAASRGDRYDLIISDPPSFAPSERAKPRAIAAYRRLHAAIARVLAEGGVLCAASCSSHVSAEEFVATLDDAALGRDDLRLCSLHGQPADHPTLPAWPEGRYLKLAVVA